MKLLTYSGKLEFWQRDHHLLARIPKNLQQFLERSHGTRDLRF
jgi:hypothetical protein